MSWGGGRDIASDMIESLKKRGVNEHTRRLIYMDLIESLFSLDWDDTCDVEGIDPAFDAALKLVEGKQ